MGMALGIQAAGEMAPFLLPQRVERESDGDGLTV